MRYILRLRRPRRWIISVPVTTGFTAGRSLWRICRSKYAAHLI